MAPAVVDAAALPTAIAILGALENVVVVLGPAIGGLLLLLDHPRSRAATGSACGVLGPFTSGLAADGERRTAWRLADERVELLAGASTWLVWPFEIEQGDELRTFVRGFVNRLGV